MNKIIVVIAIVVAFTLGTVFSADIATAATTAVRPAIDVFVTNGHTRPIPVTVNNFPTTSSEVIIANSEPIPVTGSLSSNPICPAENIQHWNKIVFQIGGTTYTHPTLPDLIGSHTYEMIVQVDPNDINEVKLLVAKKLSADGYLQGDQPVDPNVEISGLVTTVGYSTICAEN